MSVLKKFDVCKVDFLLCKVENSCGTVQLQDSLLYKQTEMNLALRGKSKRGTSLHMESYKFMWNFVSHCKM